MTVSTVVAGLLPIMWSTHSGAEIMKPLATPVLGGMVSSLLHVLVVTPVIFYWLRARHLPAEAAVDAADQLPTRRPVIVTAAVTVLVLSIGIIGWLATSEDAKGPAAPVVQTIPAGALRITLSAESGALKRGRNTFWLEFRDTNGALVDAGDVHLSATMTMPAMTMSGGVEVLRTRTPGRYQGTGDFAMAGIWQMNLEWSARGGGAISFQGGVQ
jgi:Cu(I)/Ag(I) efflux system membrane protein CusA/SilA